MATPTPGKPPAVAATPPVSTPFSQSHLTAFSPHAPRGSVVPSPQQVRKSPANSNTLYGHPSNSSFGALNFDSPSAAAALGLGDMSSLDLPLAMARGEDDQKAKLAQVLDILQVNKGRVTEEGLERLARQLGLTSFPDTHIGTVVTKSVLLAGQNFAVETNFSNDTVHSVTIDIPSANESVTKWKDKAAQILFKDLEYSSEESPLTKMLDSFADNLERLTTFDKLSVLPMLNCYEAVAGIYDSLERIYDWEVARLKEQEGIGKDAGWLERNVICTKSGRPVMHERKRVGLSVEYWQQKRHITTKPAKSVYPKTWAMVIECKTIPDLFHTYANQPEAPYIRVRVSDAWVSKSILKSNPSPEDLMNTAAHNTLLDWLEPDLILVPATDASKADAAMQGMPLDAAAQSKLPDIMFIAKFEPPISIPNYIAGWIYYSVIANPSLVPPIPHVTIDALLLPLAAEEIALSPSRQVIRQKKVSVVGKNGERSSRLHKNTLFVQKVDPGYELRELPFSHPRQLVEIMPFLRQYAFLATLMEKSFGANTEKIVANSSNTDTKKVVNKSDDFMEFMQGAEEDAQDTKILDLDVTLITEPGQMLQPYLSPKIEVVFPFCNRSANLTFEIRLNGMVSVLHENVLPKDDATSDKRPLTKEDLARTLEISEDLGIFAEYVRRRLG